MEFSEFKEKVKNVGMEEIRKDSHNYFEAVIFKDKIKDLTGVLNDFFGPPTPIWFLNDKSSYKIDEILKSFGSIRKGQTIYLRDSEGFIVIAMLWPWNDGRHTTVKVIKKEIIV